MKHLALTFLFFTLLIHHSLSQINTAELNSGNVNTITTSVPLMALNKNSIAGGIGEIGVVSSAYHHEPGLYHNPALLSRNSINNSVHFTHIPWLRALVPNLNDWNVSASYSVDSLNCFGITFDYFDLGQITFTNIVGQVTGVARPYESYMDLRYSRTITKDFSAGLGFKYFVSDLGTFTFMSSSGNVVTSEAARSYAIDFGLDYHLTFKTNSAWSIRWSDGLSINNIGPKVTYVPANENYDFIPTSISLGTMVTLSHTGERIEINDGEPRIFEIDIAYQAYKLLVPTPPIREFDSTSNSFEIVRGVDSESFTTLEGMLSSFSDAPNGQVEENQEIIHQIGFELRMITEEIRTAIRTGFFLEHNNKGGRKYQTFGIGFKWREHSIDVSYILPFATRHPLEKTWKLSVGYHF